jgi:diaminohydroxyphosphoribosylaminopyrimidine deaminase / 5-amino-6-(5-phosphoribosylamino)uracil reductase
MPPMAGVDPHARERQEEVQALDEEDVRWMHRALALAEGGRGRVSPNPLVGCVIVRDGSVVGEGFHARAGSQHAEIAALEAAGPLAGGATAYVSLEPCAHTARTGPCATALIEAGIGRVVAAMADPNPVAADGAVRLREAGVPVDVGVCEEEARRQNEVFLHGVAQRRPFVVLKSAVSLDGRIAAADGTSRWLTGEETRRRAHKLRADVDAVLVGSGTVLADDPQLTVRLSDQAPRLPLRVVLDGRGRTPPAARVVDGSAPTLLVVGPDADSARLRQTGADVAVVPPADDGEIDLSAVLGVLWARDVRSVLVEGGSTVASAFLRRGLVDKLALHVAPLLLGPQARPLVDAGPPTLAAAGRWRVDTVEQIGPDAVLTLYPPEDV